MRSHSFPEAKRDPLSHIDQATRFQSSSSVATRHSSLLSLRLVCVGLVSKRSPSEIARGEVSGWQFRMPQVALQSSFGFRSSSKTRAALLTKLVGLDGKINGTALPMRSISGSTEMCLGLMILSLRIVRAYWQRYRPSWASSQ